MIQRTGAAYKKQCGVLSAMTLDRAQNAVTYRVFGCERDRQMAYEKNLTDYENIRGKGKYLEQCHASDL